MKSVNSYRLPGKFVLHPLIHTLLHFTLAQDVGVSQRFSGLGNELPQTGHTFSVGLIIRLALHLGHLAEWSFTCLISVGDLFLKMFFRLLFGMGFLAVKRD
jgi:hypothetical protein